MPLYLLWTGGIIFPMNYTYFVNLGSWFFISFVVSLVIGSVFSNILGWLNTEKFDLKNRISKIQGLCETAKKLFSTRKVNRAMKYKNTVEGFDDTVSTIHSGISTLTVMFGILPFTVALCSRILPDGTRTLWSWILASVLSMAVTTLISIPSDYYKDFTIEKNFGFNTKTRKTFFSDIAKAFAIGTVLTVGIQYLLDMALRTFGNLTFENIFMLIFSIVIVSKILQWVFINVIMPLFNDFSPLKDKKLQKKIENLCKKCKFNVSKIEVMNESKRSKHSNAFICGSLFRKKIVLFDTILKNMTHDEIVSIIAHEIGHGKLHHLAIGNIQAILNLVIYTVLSVFLMKIPAFYSAFGYSWVTQNNVTQNYVIGFSLATTFIGAFSWVFTPLSNWISRKMEYAADRYAANHIDNRKDLENALLKLTSENMSDIAPHPAYEFANYSHPSILNRILAIRENEKE